MPFESPNYTQAPNDLFDSLMCGMSETELKVTLAVVRGTLGYHRDGFRCSVSKMQRMTGLSYNGVIAGAEAAEKRGTIERVTNGKGSSEWRVCFVVVPSASEGTIPQQVRVVPSLDEGQSRVKESIKKEFKEESHAPKPRVRSAVEIEVERLMAIFIAETNIPIRQMASQAEITKLWRNPMRDIIALANGQSEWLLKETIHHMRSQNPALTIKTPNSLLGCAPDVWSRYRPKTSSVYVDPMQPYYDMLERQKANAPDKNTE